MKSLSVTKCDYLKESYWAVRYCGAVYNAVQGVSYFSFEFVDEIQCCARSNENYWREVSDSPSQSVQYAVQGTCVSDL